MNLKLEKINMLQKLYNKSMQDKATEKVKDHCHLKQSNLFLEARMGKNAYL